MPATAATNSATASTNSAKATANPATGQQWCMCSCSVCILIACVSSQSAEEGEVVQLQGQLLEPSAKRARLDREYHNWTR